MLTQFVLNQNNLLSTFSKRPQTPQQDKTTQRYVSEQDLVTASFERELEQNVIRYILGTRKSDINLLLPIKNALWSLWNNSWNLGINHAANDIRAKFHNNSQLAEFAKKKNDEIKQLSDEIDQINSQIERINIDYKKEDGSYKLNRILKDSGRKGTFTDDDRNKALQAIQQSERELNQQKQDKLTKLIELQTVESNKPQRIRKQREVTTPIIKTEQNPVEKTGRKRVRSQPVLTNGTPQYQRTAPTNNRQIEAINDELDELNSKYKKPNGTYNLNRIREDGTSINDIKQREKYLNIEREKVLDELERIENAQPRVPRQPREKKVREIGESKQRSTPPVRKGNIIPTREIKSGKGRATQQVTSRRYEQQQAGGTNLEQSEFGQIYLEQRLNNLAKPLAQKYHEQLVGTKENPGIIPQYFNGNSLVNDRKLVEDIRKITGESLSDDYKQAYDILNSAVSETRENSKAAQIRRLEEDVKKGNKGAVYTLAAIRNQKSGDRTYSLNEDERKAIQLLIAEEAPETITVNELQQYQQQAKRHWQRTKTTNITHRIAQTEMAHAYNLGRLDYYINNDIQYVKWNVSGEHLRRNLSATSVRKYKSVHRLEILHQPRNKDSRKIARRSGALPTPGFQTHGTVCPVCWERSQRDEGLGAGIYQLAQLRRNPQLMPALHAHCGCWLSPVDENDIPKITVPINIGSFFDNNVAKWAGAGILGTVLMYGAFWRTRNRPIFSTNPIPTPRVPRIVRSIVETLDENRDNVMRVAGKVANNADDGDATPLIQPPLPILFIPEIVDISPIEEQVNNALNQPYENSKYSTVVNQVVRNNISIVHSSNNVSPNYNDAVNQSLRDLQQRVEQYVNYTKSTPSLLKRQILSSYKKDLDYLNKTINSLQDSNGMLYAQIRNIQQLIRDGERTISTSLQIDDVKGVFASTSTGRQLYNELAELDATLRNRIQLLQPNSYYDELIQIREQVLQNTDIAEDYFKKIKDIVSKNFSKIRKNDNVGIARRVEELFDDVYNSSNITIDKYKEISEELTKLETILNVRLNKVSKSIIDVDIEQLLTKRMNEDEVLMAMTVLAYRKQIRLLKNKIYSMTNLLIDKLQ
ncbi:hypothetical protein [Scytonema sp. NUACC26]|uniref:hypothetical protein n=1 Tax=Scytonema sp. NUACC26 TaxID=3140176 RepID=UPI0034DCB0DA